jgi:hypothetical protein
MLAPVTTVMSVPVTVCPAVTATDLAVGGCCPSEPEVLGAALAPEEPQLVGAGLQPDDAIRAVRIDVAVNG